MNVERNRIESNRSEIESGSRSIYGSVPLSLFGIG